MTRIEAGKGLGEVELVRTRFIGGVAYETSGWWAVNQEGRPLAGPAPSERTIRHEVAELRRLIAAGKYLPR